MNEFEIIESYFKQPFNDFSDFYQNQPKGDFLPKINFGIGDDCAIFESSNKYQIVTSVDNFIESVHFFSDLTADLIAYKALVRSLSDLMAMGAQPLGFTLALTVNRVQNTQWFESFSKGLVQCARQYHIPLVGGDLSKVQSKNSPIMVSIQVFGFTPKNQILKRSHLKLNDAIFVTGDIGFAGFILEKIRGQKMINQDLLVLFQKPKIPLNFAGKIVSLVNAGIDISDGLLQDMTHLVKSSHLGILLDLERIEKELLDPHIQSEMSLFKGRERINQLIRFMNQGEDYQLIFSCNQKNISSIRQIAHKTNTKITLVGKVIAEEKLQLQFQGREIKLDEKLLKGYQHF